MVIYEPPQGIVGPKQGFELLGLDFVNLSKPILRNSVKASCAVLCANGNSDPSCEGMKIKGECDAGFVDRG